MTFTIDELTIPRTLDEKGGADFAEMTAVRNEIEAEVFGSNDLAVTPDELLPQWRDEYSPKRLLVARIDGRIVARGNYEVQREASVDVAWLSVEVLNAHRNQGIGTALLRKVEAMATDEGRTTLQGYSLAREQPGERLASPTGFGSLPLNDDGVRFLIANGYELAQVERASRLTLPVDDATMAGLMSDTVATAGPDYRVHTWAGPTPERWLADMAVLMTRMSTDAPAAGLDIEEDLWTPERIRDYEERHAESPRTEIFAAVEHVPSSKLVGFTGLAVPQQTERAVTQEDTIVLREHRGHRLGMLLKLANIEHLGRFSPGHPSITTFNAEENRHMLSVNEAVGFAAVVYDGAWKKVVRQPVPPVVRTSDSIDPQERG